MSKHAGSVVPDAAREIPESLSGSKDPTVIDKRKMELMLKMPRANSADPAAGGSAMTCG